MTRRMSWRRRTLIAAISGLLAAGVTQAGLLSVAQANDPSIGTNEYTGTPQTDSAVTETGDSAFPGLKVTVSQTENINNQAVTVSWTGAAPTVASPTSFLANYMQVMQCWGDDPKFPDAPQPARETCEYGSYSSTSPDLGTSTSGTVYARSRTVVSADTLERRATGADNVQLNYGVQQGSSGAVPFWPVTSNWPHQANDNQKVLPLPGQSVDSAGAGVFGYADTNEKDYAYTNSDGTGEQLFEMQTTIESPSLGCGAPVTAGSTAGRACWLVVVPRGITDDATKTGTVVGQNNVKGLLSSPLSMSNWQHRLAFRMNFNSVGSACPLGAAERRIVGSELAKDAMASWSTKLCKDTAVPYSLTTESEGVARGSVTSSVPDSARMAMTSEPLPPDPDHPIAYAPVALTGFAIGFQIERKIPDLTGTTPDTEKELAGTRLAHLNLTPRLVAKLLTESYRFSVGSTISNGVQPPAYLSGNPADLFADPDFIALNPEAKYLIGRRDAASASARLLVTVANSDVALAMWRWIDADGDARTFLDGKADPWGMKVNPAYKEVTLPLQNFPESDPTCTPPTVADAADKAPDRCVIDWAPYMENLTDAAQRASAGNPGGVGTWKIPSRDGVAVAGWGKADPQTAGSRFVLSVTSLSEAARFGLQTASLRNATGKFVRPDQAGLLAGQAAMTPTAVEPQVRQLVPAKATGDAYPGTMLTYAATAIADIEASDKTSRAQYANFLEYTALDGQTPGLDFGQLPPGYAPLSNDLRAQALSAADSVLSGKLPGAAATTSPTTSPTPTTADTTTTEPTTATTTPTAVPNTGAPPVAVNPSASHSIAPAAVVTGRTPGDPRAIATWVLIAGLGVGIAAGIAAPFVRPRRPRVSAGGTPAGGS